MNHKLTNRTVIAAAALFTLATLAACVVGGYDGDGGGYVGSVGYVGGYYEPGGYDVGGWARGYRAGPPRAAARGRGAPSIPHAARGGGHATGARAGPKR